MALTTQDNESIELNASQANLVWSYFPESKSTQKEKYPFQFASPQVRFSNLKHQLQIYQSIPQHEDIAKIGLNALISLAVNDYASSAGNNGGMLLPTSSGEICFAKIALRQDACVTVGETRMRLKI